MGDKILSTFTLCNEIFILSSEGNILISLKYILLEIELFQNPTQKKNIPQNRSTQCYVVYIVMLVVHRYVLIIKGTNQCMLLQPISSSPLDIEWLFQLDAFQDISP